MEVDADVQPRRPARDACTAARVRLRVGGLLACYWLLMFVGSHVKLSESSTVFRVRDKVLHFAAYAGLALLAVVYQHFRKRGVGWVDLAAVWGITAAYGVFDEITQIPVGRTCDPLDWLADAAGAAAGLMAFLVLRAALDTFSGRRSVRRRQVHGEAS